MTDKPTLNGCELTSRELELVRAEIESLDVIERATDEMRELIASRWPHLLAKLHLAKLHSPEAELDGERRKERAPTCDGPSGPSRRPD